MTVVVFPLSPFGTQPETRCVRHQHLNHVWTATSPTRVPPPCVRGSWTCFRGQVGLYKYNVLLALSRCLFLGLRNLEVRMLCAEMSRRLIYRSQSRQDRTVPALCSFQRTTFVRLVQYELTVSISRACPGIVTLLEAMRRATRPDVSHRHPVPWSHSLSDPTVCGPVGAATTTTRGHYYWPFASSLPHYWRLERHFAR